MSDDDTKADRTALNDAMRHAFRVNRVTARPGMIRNTVNAAIRRAAGRDVPDSPGAETGARTGASPGATEAQGGEREGDTRDEERER
jgi:hypothetical protein